MQKNNKHNSSAHSGCNLAATAQTNGYFPHDDASSDRLKPLSCVPAFDADCQLIKTEQLAEILGVKAETVVKARSTGLGDFPPYVRFNRSIRYRISDVVDWINRHTQAFAGEIL